MEPFVTLIDSIPFWGWFVLAIALIAAEVVLPTTHMLWPAAGAVVTGVLVLVLGDPFPAWQVAAFAVFTVIAPASGSVSVEQDRDTSATPFWPDTLSRPRPAAWSNSAWLSVTSSRTKFPAPSTMGSPNALANS